METILETIGRIIGEIVGCTITITFIVGIISALAYMPYFLIRYGWKAFYKEFIQR